MNSNADTSKPKLKQILLITGILLFGLALSMKVDDGNIPNLSSLIEVHGVLGWLGVKKDRYGNIDRTNIWVDSGKGAVEFYIPGNYKCCWKELERLKKGDPLIVLVSSVKNKWIWELTSNNKLVISYSDRASRLQKSIERNNRMFMYFSISGLASLLCSVWLFRRDKIYKSNNEN